eukprot:scaffold26749_cov17-Prasinocladus_malaysianus.AAC.1
MAHSMESLLESRQLPFTDRYDVISFALNYAHCTQFANSGTHGKIFHPCYFTGSLRILRTDAKAVVAYVSLCVLLIDRPAYKGLQDKTPISNDTPRSILDKIASANTLVRMNRIHKGENATGLNVFSTPPTKASASAGNVLRDNNYSEHPKHCPVDADAAGLVYDRKRLGCCCRSQRCRLKLPDCLNADTKAFQAKQSGGQPTNFHLRPA